MDQYEAYAVDQQKMQGRVASQRAAEAQLGVNRVDNSPLAEATRRIMSVAKRNTTLAEQMNDHANRVFGAIPESPMGSETACGSGFGGQLGELLRAISDLICAAIGASIGAVGMGAIAGGKIDAYRTGLKRAQATADYQANLALGYGEALRSVTEYAARIEPDADYGRKAREQRDRALAKANEANARRKAAA